MTALNLKSQKINEDLPDVSVIWKKKAEELNEFVCSWVDYKDGMILTIRDQGGTNE